MKRILSLLLVLMLMISVVACKPEATSGSMEVAETKEAQTPAEETKDAQTAPEETKEAPAEANKVHAMVEKYFAELDGNMMIKTDEFVQKVRAGEDLKIFDIRSAEDYAKGHVKGAVNIPWGTAIAEHMKDIPQGEPVYVYCYSGQTAGQAVMHMNMAGIQAKSVAYGYNFGITKIDGHEDIVNQDAVELKELNNPIDPELQTALNDYYKGLAASKEAGYPNYLITEENLKEKLDAKDESIYLVSARAEKDYAEGHIPGAHLMSYGKGMQEKFKDLPKDKKIVVYCYSGQTAGQVIGGLRLMGYDAVSLRAGFGTEMTKPNGWSNQEGYPIEK